MQLQHKQAALYPLYPNAACPLTAQLIHPIPLLPDPYGLIAHRQYRARGIDQTPGQQIDLLLITRLMVVKDTAPANQPLIQLVTAVGRQGDDFPPPSV